jgi:hypothetical protein
MTMIKPRSRPDVITRAVRSQRILYDNLSKSSHVLNETAEFVWNLCDGEHTISEIAAEIRASFDVPADADLEADIERTLGVLMKKGLLVTSGNGRDQT